MLVPAGFLVLVLLGAMAVDNGAAYLGQRQLADVVAAAANDAAGAALADGSFYGQGRIVIDPTVAAQVVCRTVTASGDTDLHQLQLAVAVQGAAVSVRAVAVVDAVFGRFVPAFRHRVVRAQASAVAAQGAVGGDSTPTPSPFAPIAC